MIIKDIKIGKINLPLKRDYKKYYSITDKPEEIVIKIITDTEEIGIGSAATTYKITGDTEESILGALRIIKNNLIGKEIDDLQGTFKLLDNVIANNTSAKAAVDMAVYDLFGKKYNMPLYKLFGGYRNSIETDITINLGSTEDMVSASLDAVMNGYTYLKLKVGTDTHTAIDRIKCISKAIRKGTLIRIDADQSWRPKEAVRTIRKLEDMDLDIDFVEQPVKARDYEGLKFVKENVDVEILADESVLGPAETLKIVKDRSADLINIKLMKCGGFHNALKMVNMAEIPGIKCMMGCMLESKIGITAAASFAVARSNMINADLDTMIMFEEDSIIGGAEIRNNIITLSDEPGLGIKDILGWQEIK